ncbi:M48 family metalloprotease [Occallatibacter riparius]|uniref:M48 family metalloprotease n=1 Tax=Occallatibacter riparius TaxID=1002689 RepID=A0A9J7BUW6_9BACT|nr:M48 family metalloprotease [Occallatibacter riparius]UWZ84710.1 M48 family metalloprotease [Occallatibacter riparius]
MILLIVAFFPAWLHAQDDDDADDDSDGPFVNLIVTYAARGDATVSFYSYQLANLGGIQAALEQALHCPAGSLVNPPAQTELPRYLKSRPLKDQERYLKYREQMRHGNLIGTCAGAMQRAGLLLSTNIPLDRLNGELRSAGIRKLWVHITYPRARFAESSAAGRSPRLPEEELQANSARAELYDDASYAIDTASASPDAIHLAFGLRRQDAIRAAVLPVIFLITPIVLCLWMRRAAIRDSSADPIGAWFSYLRVLLFSGNCLLLIWIVGQTVRKGFDDLIGYYTSAHSASAVALNVGVLFLPPWIAYFVCLLLSYRVFAQARGNRWTRGEFLASHALTLAAQFLPVMCLIASIEMAPINGQASMALLFCVYASYKLCTWLLSRVTGMQFEPLATGELRDCVFTFAKKAAVELRGVFVMPAGKSQMANAFASRQRMVMFTDYLLSRLNKREVAAIAAHEITHIQKKHAMWTGLAFFGLMFSPEIFYWILRSVLGAFRHALELRRVADGAAAAPGLSNLVHFGDRVMAFPELILVLYIIGLVLYYLQSRYFEHVADAGALQLSGDPEAVITALLKLARLNLLPVQWDRVTGSLMTHPSMLRRVERLAKIGQVPPERLQELMREQAVGRAEPTDDATGLSEEQFKEGAPRNPVVTLRAVSELLALKKWVLRFCSIATPGLVALAIHHAALPHPAPAYIGGAIACFAIYVLVGEWQSVWGLSRRRQRFVTRLEAEGIACGEDRAELIDLNPHPVLRTYDLVFVWDFGMLFLAKDRLSYAGDQLRFALRPEQVLAVRLGPGIPDWLPVRRIYIDWQLEPGAPVQTWNLGVRSPCAFWRIRSQVKAKYENLLRWKLSSASFPEAPAALQSLPAPSIGEITNHALRSMVSIRRYLKVVFLNMILAIAACVVFRIPSAWYVCLFDFLMLTWSFSPFWFFKEAGAAAQTNEGLRGHETLAREAGD